MLEIRPGIVVYNANAIDILPTLPQRSIDLSINDPPNYKVVRDTWDHQWTTKDEYLEWCRTWLILQRPLLKQSASVYVWGTVGEKQDTIIHQKLLLDRLGYYFKDWITWSKTRGIGQRKGWLYTREELLWYVVDNTQFIWNTDHQYGTEKRKRDQGLPEGTFRPGQNGKPPKWPFKRYTNVWGDVSENVPDVLQKGSHSTPKPFALIERIILAHTQPGDTILDPFMGSGTTIEVCIKHNRCCIGIEKDPAIYQETIERLQI